MCTREIGCEEEQRAEDGERTDLRLRQVPDPAVHPALEEVHLREDHLVVQPPELGEQAVDERDRGLVLLCLQLSVHPVFVSASTSRE